MITENEFFKSSKITNISNESVVFSVSEIGKWLNGKELKEYQNIHKSSNEFIGAQEIINSLIKIESKDNKYSKKKPLNGMKKIETLSDKLISIVRKINGDFYIRKFFQNTSETSHHNIMARLSMLITFYSALQGGSKFFIPQLASKIVEIDCEIKEINNNSDLLNEVISKLRSLEINAYSLITKYLFWDKYWNSQNKDEYFNYFIYDTKVKDAIKFKNDYTDEFSKYSNCYKKFIEYKNWINEDLYDIDLTLWSGG